MTTPAFLITIDTEGDDIWSPSRRVTTENARFLPRFQGLCEEYGFKPTYLVNHEMASDDGFASFGRSVVRRGAGEIGLHIHPWNSPPFEGEPRNDVPHVYLFEVPQDLLREKIEHLTRLLEERFEVRARSHRAGRWGFDERVARLLSDAGYLVDCSVTPGVSWRKHLGAPDGRGGTDYFGFPDAPYFLDLDDIRRSGSSSILEVPVTIRPNHPAALRGWHHAFETRRLGRTLRRFLGPPFSWLRPNGKNLEGMLAVVDWALARRAPALEFMLHSSEFMPGGSPTFRTAEQIETLYLHLKRLFERLSTSVRGQTLSEFRSAWTPA
jgi:hypothetical protein